MVHLRIRVDDELQRRIEEAAKAHGVSTTKEVVTRLTASFTRDMEPGSEALERPSGRVGGLLELVTLAAHTAGHGALLYSNLFVDTPEEWVDDSAAYEQAVLAANRVFDALRPKQASDEAPVPPTDIGVDTADGILGEIAKQSGQGRPSLRQRTELLRQALGPELIARLKSTLESKGKEDSSEGPHPRTKSR